MKLILFILWSGFKIYVSKDVSTLTSHTPLDTSTLNPDISFEDHIPIKGDKTHIY